MSSHIHHYFHKIHNPPTVTNSSSPSFTSARTMSIIKSILECLWGPSPDVYQTDARTSAVASDIVNILLTGETREAIQKGVKEQVDANGWSDSIAQAILHGLNDAIKAGAEMAGPAADALNKAKEAAVDFAKEHPVFTILLALGVLAALAPWVLEVLGFGELGPIAGSFAARWQAAYAGYVPRGALFTYFQRLGMKWHWVG
ncbi:endoribonuclease L-PSP family protein [Aspergillus niger]|nr:endoribonuclease L-PSP family protein [Aspergillus niger]